MYRGASRQPMASVTWRAIHFGRRMGGNCQAEQLPTGVLQDQQSMQQPKRHCRHYEQVDRGNAVGTIVKEGLPALRGWPPLGHVFMTRDRTVRLAEITSLSPLPCGILGNDTQNDGLDRR
jgi:hypothetical protein